MSLVLGTKLGPYEIQAPLGTGGMGEVYCARDTRLQRTVAIKILPAHLSSDPVRKQRFECEAKTISRLNHPHICVLYDVGNQDGMDFLVMECLEGETLAKRLEKGPLPLDQVLKYGAQITDALDKAHRTGVIHRDLTPGNIMLTPAGAKLLDFGLAKPALPLAAAAALTEGATQSRPMTQEGMVLGTFQYMSPEQVEGKELDARSDIFSLGAVLYETLTGQKAFPGRSQLSIASAILEREPTPISSIKPLTPPAFDHAVKKCLAKNPDERWQSASDLASEMRWIAEGGSQAGTPLGFAGRHKRRWAITAAALFAALTIVLSLAIMRRPETRSPGATIRFLISPPIKEMFESGMALSPNGQQLVFVTRSGAGTQLWLRPLNAVEAHPLRGTQNAWQPFWSPDGRYLAFFADRKLKKMDVASGAVQTLCDASDPRGGTWSASGVIVFAPKFNMPLYQVPAEGGEPTPATTLDSKEIGHRWPYFLPDGRHFLFFRYQQQLVRKPIWVGSLDSKEQKQILESESMVEYAPPGYLIYVRDHTLVAQRFDATTLKIEGSGMPLAEAVEAEGENGEVTGRSAFTISESGVLAYSSGQTTITQLTWYDRKGTALGTVGPPGDYTEPAISPDGRSVAVSQANSGEARNIWIYDIAKGIQSRLTFEATGDKGSPVWTADGNRILFSSLRKGLYDLDWKLSSGAAKEELLYSSDLNKFPDDVSPDGRYLIFEEDHWRRGHLELWVLPLQGERKPRPYLQTESDLMHAAFSPDGRWVAYVSTEPGREQQIFVQSFPAGDANFQISNGSADSPRWRGDGKELFYLTADNRIMAVPIEKGPGFRAGIPRPLFQIPIIRPFVTAHGPAHTQFGVSRDGLRILVNTVQEESVHLPITVIANWTTESR